MISNIMIKMGNLKQLDCKNEHSERIRIEVVTNHIREHVHS